MKLCSVMLFSVILVLVLLAIQTQGIKFADEMDTSSGFCVDERFGSIPVGSYGYNDEKCEKIFCIPGGYSGQGCNVPRIDLPGCRLVASSGHYPNCCRIYVECDDDSDEMIRHETELLNDKLRRFNPF